MALVTKSNNCTIYNPQLISSRLKEKKEHFYGNTKLTNIFQRIIKMLTQVITNKNTNSQNNDDHFTIIIRVNLVN